MTLLHDRYELGELLGRGGLADVHAATDTRLGRRVAVKLLRDSAVDHTDRARFESEARTLAALSHPGLVTVLDAGLTETADRPFLVLELVTGPSLARALDHGPLPLGRVRPIGRAVAEALAHVHAAGVVHRDVKPGNVLLRTDGAVKLADFGIARIIGDLARHTRTGHAVGTAAYISPEQVRGAPVAGAADVYALGLTLLEALTGRREYPGHPAEAAFARLSRRPEVPADLPPAVRDLLLAMTELEPAHRPNAAAVAVALEEPAPPPTVPIAAATPPAPERTRVRMRPAPVVRPPAPAEPPPSPAPAPAAAEPEPEAPQPSGPTLQDRLAVLRARAAEVPQQQWVLGTVALLMLLLLVVAALAP
ncbi:serine/threonine-protein kinase [Nocardioides litoris]|uniref:serine/threonine-protein kinase n=1 Tax=Nocardioides litoris TaxID=1926648 RepID=UPI00111EB2A3|nr:serine/threonine-protein kinase [Nocardioides litoris]